MPILRLRRLMIVIIASLSSFWPFFSVGFRNSTTIESSLLRASLMEQQENREGSIVALCFLIPFILDGLSDVLERWFWNEKKKNTVHEMLDGFETIFLFVGLSIAPCLAFVSPDYDSLALLWLCSSRFQIIAVLGTLHVSIFSRSNDHALPGWMSSSVIIILVTLGMNLTTWSSLIGSNSGSIVIVATAIMAVVLAMIIVPLGPWFLQKSITRCNYHSKVNPNDDGNDNLDNTENKWNYSDFRLLFGSSSYIIILVTSMVLGSLRQFTPQMLLAYKSSFIIVEVSLLFYCLRKNKYDNQYNMTASILSRKQYLRYIAHEIRTPLNSAALGLKLMCDLLATIENKDDLDYELCDTAGDVSKTVKIAVSILADLMTFNKIEGT